MQDKFGAFFEVFGRDFYAANPRIWDFKATTIASLDTLKRAEHKRTLLENRKWDLIIFDEAHRLSAMDYSSGKVEKTQIIVWPKSCATITTVTRCSCSQLPHTKVRRITVASKTYSPCWKMTSTLLALRNTACLP